MTGRKYRRKQETNDHPEHEFHIPPKVVVQVAAQIIGRYGLHAMCDKCQIAILSTLLGMMTYHGHDADKREAFIDEIMQHAHEMTGGMELHFEHGGRKQ
jgi:hypothetical protein